MAFSSIAKNLNDKIILSCIKHTNIFTKQEIAKQSELSFPTASKIIDEFVERKIVLSLGIEENSQGGRKAAVFRLNVDFAHALILFLQEQNIYYQIVNALGEPILQYKKEYKLTTTLTNIYEIIDEILQQDSLIGAISIGIPGSVSNGKIYDIDGYDSLKECDLQNMLSEHYSIPVKVSNNMNAIATGMADKLSCTTENLVCIHLAQTGPGCSAVVNGKAVDGFCGFQGEIGFIPFYDDKTLQEIALSGFQNVNFGEYIGKIAISLITILNPRSMIFYVEQKEREWEVAMEEYCKKYLPERALPEFVYSDSYQKDYFYGLTLLGTTLLYEEIGQAN
ncbi:MAG: ROK family protein [Lachnospiraceae bacterium]|nr:ROK family protein [Lachnospiraceae bacterium]